MPSASTSLRPPLSAGSAQRLAGDGVPSGSILLYAAASPVRSSVAAPGGDYRVVRRTEAKILPSRDSYLGTIDELPALIAAHDSRRGVCLTSLTRISAVIEGASFRLSSCIRPAVPVRVRPTRLHYDQPFFAPGIRCSRPRADLQAHRRRFVSVISARCSGPLLVATPWTSRLSLVAILLPTRAGLVNGSS